MQHVSVAAWSRPPFCGGGRMMTGAPQAPWLSGTACCTPADAHTHTQSRHAQPPLRVHAPMSQASAWPSASTAGALQWSTTLCPHAHALTASQAALFAPLPAAQAPGISTSSADLAVEGLLYLAHVLLDLLLPQRLGLQQESTSRRHSGPRNTRPGATTPGGLPAAGAQQAGRLRSQQDKVPHRT